MIYKPHSYQDYGAKHIYKTPYCGLFMEMGLGKTVATLTAIRRLMHFDFEVNKVLVIAPLNVAKNVWTDEVMKWDHLKKLKLVKILGTETERLRALRSGADIYIINRENVVWLIAALAGAWPFDMVVVDESSSFKSHKAARFKKLKLVRPRIKRMVLLTGTPAPNTLMDLWPQIYLLDQGERLESTITGFRERYFRPDKTNGHITYSYKPKIEANESIHTKIADICISMRSKDYLQLPERINRIVHIDFSDKVRQQYRRFEQSQILKLQNEKEIAALNAAALCNKLVQFANGALYDENKNWHEIHDEKLKALGEIIDTANGAPVMVFHWFKHDLERIQTYLRKAGIPYRVLNHEKDVKDWNDKKISVFLLHPASAGHGLNLQAGGNIIVWFGLTWSLELYQQANARLDRQGQTKVVIIHHLVAKGTMDVDIMRAIERKRKGQDALMEAVNVRLQRAA